MMEVGDEAHKMGLVVKLEPETDNEEDDHTSLNLKTQHSHSNWNACAHRNSRIVAEASHVETHLHCSTGSMETPKDHDPETLIKPEPFDDDQLPDVVPVDLYRNENFSTTGDDTNFGPLHCNKNMKLKAFEQSASRKSSQKNTDSVLDSYTNVRRFPFDKSKLKKTRSHQHDVTNKELSPSTERPVRNRRKASARTSLQVFI